MPQDAVQTLMYLSSSVVLQGEGQIAGGLIVLKAGNGGVVYSHLEKTFGDHAPMAEVRLRNVQQSGRGVSRCDVW